jgi:hypothetical protein
MLNKKLIAAGHLGHLIFSIGELSGTHRRNCFFRQGLLTYLRVEEQLPLPISQLTKL